jgi:glycosyltransferase involved in cell wall biosynthesis
MAEVPPQPVPPAVSIVVRSYNRVPALVELLERLLAQRHGAFEVVVVEQSTDVAPEDAARLDGLARDPRLRILKHAPLGGARAQRRRGRGARRDRALRR